MFGALKDMKTYPEAFELYRNKPVQKSARTGKSSTFRKHRIHQRIEAMRVSQLLYLVEEEKNKPPVKDVSATLELGVNIVALGRNVCFHGFGEKAPVVAEAFRGCSSSFSLITVNGGQMELTARSLFTTILQLVEKKLNQEGLAYEYSADREVDKIARNIHALLKRLPLSKFLLLFHALDNWCFLRAGAFEGLALLAGLHNFRVVGCVDSVNFPIMASRRALQNFGFVFLALNTYVPYAAQLCYLDALVHPKHEKRSPQVVESIIRTLTLNQRELVLFVLRELLVSEKGAVEEAEMFNRALWEAKVTSHAQFVENLKEAFYHNLLARKTEANSTAYKTPLSSYTLESLLGEKAEEKKPKGRGRKQEG